MGVRNLPPSSNPLINALLMQEFDLTFPLFSTSVSGWEPEGPQGNQISYSFPSARTYYLAHREYTFPLLYPEFGSEALAAAYLVAGWNPFTVEQEGVVSAIEGMFDAVTLVDMVRQAETTLDGAMIRFAQTDSPTPSIAFAAPPGLLDGPMAGDVWLETRSSSPIRGNFEYWLIMHETLHALGLKHGHEEGLLGDTTGTGALGLLLDPIQGDDWGDPLPVEYDSPEFTLMTYRDYVGSDTIPSTGHDYPRTFMMLDILALQHLYGADYSTNSGNTLYQWNPATGQRSVNGTPGESGGRNVVFETIWDGGGNDTYDFANYVTHLDVDLAPGGWVNLRTQLASLGDGQFARGNIASAMLFRDNGSSTIENANGGTGNDTISGNDAFNVLRGNAGNDSLHGRSGNDTLFGGLGNDNAFGGDGNDTFDAGDGNDTLMGELGNDSIDAGVGSDWLDGGAGGDTLRGGPANGTSTVGGIVVSEFGNDTASYQSATSRVVVHLPNGALNQGDAAGDTYINIESYALSEFDDLFTGADQTGVISIFNPRGDYATGGGGNDTMSGEAGDDTLEGGAGLDSLVGGIGSDRLIGGGDNDILVGGAGVDYLEGGAGNDTFYVDTFSDIVVEAAGGGTDLVISSDSYIFHANIENVTLTGTGGFGLIGNDLANVLTGNSGGNGITGGLGDDTIDGGAGNDTIDGGAGADAMNGGSGVDVYFVDNAGDVVTEVVQNATFDTIWTTASIVLPVGVEIVILNGGTLAIDATGNDGASDNTPNLMLGNNAVNTLTTFGGDDIILGLGGNDIINAGGGSLNGYDLIVGGVGADTLTGGSGHDYFAYTSIDEGGDTITDFTTVVPADRDILDLRNLRPGFTGYAGITTAAQAVTRGHLTYTQSGANVQVFADANGGIHNPGEQVLLATLLNVTAASVMSLSLI